MALLQAAKVARHVQAPLLGLGLLMTPFGHAAPPPARVVMMGLGIALMARLIAQPLPALAAGPLAVRAAVALAGMLLAFAAMALVSWVADGSWHHSPFLLAWCAAASMCAALLGLARPPPYRAVVAAEGPRAALLRRAVANAAGHGIDVVGTLDLADPGHAAMLDAWVATGAVTMVVVPADLDERHLRAVSARLCDTEIHLKAAFLTGLHGEALPMSDVLPPPVSGVRWAVKRGFDLTVALGLLAVLAPLLLLIAAAIRRESPGPALFRQWRFGQGSRAVLIYKFRTMRSEAGDVRGAERTLARDPRVTRLGRILRRLSLDELPQLFNVVRGEMSLVGPRPHATHMQVEGRLYHDAVDTYRARHRVLPGITGWAQVNGSRGEVDTLEKAHSRVRLDLWYIANWSPVLDLWILVRTALGGFATLRAD